LSIQKIATRRDMSIQAHLKDNPYVGISYIFYIGPFGL